MKKDRATIKFKTLGVEHSSVFNYICTGTICFSDRYLFTTSIWLSTIYLQIVRVRSANTSSNFMTFACCIFETQELIDTFAALLILIDKILPVDNYTPDEMTIIAKYLFGNLDGFKSELVLLEKYIYIIFKLMDSGAQNGRDVAFIKRFIGDPLFEDTHKLDIGFIRECFARYEAYAAQNVKTNIKLSKNSPCGEMVKPNSSTRCTTSIYDETLKYKSLDDLFEPSVVLHGTVYKINMMANNYDGTLLDLGSKHYSMPSETVVKATEFSFLQHSKFTKSTRGLGVALIKPITDIKEWFKLPVAKNKLIIATSLKDELRFYYITINFNIRDVRYADKRTPLEYLKTSLDSIAAIKNTCTAKTDTVILFTPSTDVFCLCWQDYIICLEIICITIQALKYRGRPWFSKRKILELKGSYLNLPEGERDMGSIFINQPLLLTYLMWNIVIYYPNFNFSILNTFTKDLCGQSFFKMYYSCAQQIYNYEKTVNEILTSLQSTFFIFENFYIKTPPDINLFGPFQTSNLKNYSLVTTGKSKAAAIVKKDLKSKCQLQCLYNFSINSTTNTYLDITINSPITSIFYKDMEMCKPTVYQPSYTAQTTNSNTVVHFQETAPYIGADIFDSEYDLTEFDAAFLNIV